MYKITAPPHKVLTVVSSLLGTPSCFAVQWFTFEVLLYIILWNIRETHHPAASVSVNAGVLSVTVAAGAAVRAPHSLATLMGHSCRAHSLPSLSSQEPH